MPWLVVLMIYTLVGLVLLAPIVFFAFSLASRKSYSCPQCGERITTEYLDAEHCSMCGAPLSLSRQEHRA